MLPPETDSMVASGTGFEDGQAVHVSLCSARFSACQLLQHHYLHLDFNECLCAGPGVDFQTRGGVRK